MIYKETIYFCHFRTTFNENDFFKMFLRERYSKIMKPQIHIYAKDFKIKVHVFQVDQSKWFMILMCQNPHKSHGSNPRLHQTFLLEELIESIMKLHEVWSRFETSVLLVWYKYQLMKNWKAFFLSYTMSICYIDSRSTFQLGMCCKGCETPNFT